jgi:hypothetical protein
VSLRGAFVATKQSPAVKEIASGKPRPRNNEKESYAKNAIPKNLGLARCHRTARFPSCSLH